MTSPKIPQTGPDGYPGSFKYTPMVALRNLFVGFCQGLFFAAPKGSYHWDEDDQLTEIVIQDESPVKEEVMQKRPLITLTRGNIQAYGFGLDDMLSYEPDIDRKTKSILIPGTMTVNCCSRVAIEAENIAWVIFEHIWLLRDLLLKNGLFDTGRNCGLGAPSPAGSIIAGDSGDEWICVPVSVPFQFVRTSSFTPLGKEVVRNIEQRLEVGPLRSLRNVGPPAEVGGNFPLQVTSCPPGKLINSPDARGGTATFASQDRFLPKQRHPLNPAVEVEVRTVRPYHPGVRSAVAVPGTSVPFIKPCVEES